MKRTLLAVAASAMLAAPAAWSHPNGYGMGPGMMWDDEDTTPGRGWGARGWGMGPGMMGGYGPGGYYGLDLSKEQRTKIAAMQEEFAKKQWVLMDSMHELRWSAYNDGKFDEQTARKSFDAMTVLRKQMFENSLAMRKNIDAVLTKEQRDRLSRRWGGR